MPRIDSNTINTITNIVKSPADAIAIVKGSNGEMTANTIAGITGLTSSLANIIATNPKLKAGLSKLGIGASMFAFGNDAYTIYKDVDEGNVVKDQTVVS